MRIGGIKSKDNTSDILTKFLLHREHTRYLFPQGLPLTPRSNNNTHTIRNLEEEASTPETHATTKLTHHRINVTHFQCPASCAMPHRGPHSSSLTTGMAEVNHVVHFRRHTMPHRGPLSSSLTTRMNEATSTNRNAGRRTDTFAIVAQAQHHASQATHTHTKTPHDHTYEPQHDYRQYTNKDYKPSTKTKMKHPKARNHRHKVFHTNSTFLKPTNRRGHVSHNSSNPTKSSLTKATPNNQDLHVDQPGSPRPPRKTKRRKKDKEGHSPEQQHVTHSNRPIKTQRNSTKPKIDDSSRNFLPTSRPPICSPTERITYYVLRTSTKPIRI
jgi:hypothetical protein